jgi:hypothetical protein
MKEAPGSSETSVLTRATWRNNPEDTILNSTIIEFRDIDRYGVFQKQSAVYESFHWFHNKDGKLTCKE